MKKLKIFQKNIAILVLIACGINVQMFANDTEANSLATTTISKGRKDLKLHKFDLSIEPVIIECRNLDGNRVPGGFAGGYFSYSYSFLKYFCSPYVRLRLGIGTDLSAVCVIPVDITLGVRFSDIKHNMQYDVYVYNVSGGPYYPTIGFMPFALFCKSGVDFRYKSFLFGAYLLTAPRLGLGLNIGYSFEI